MRKLLPGLAALAAAFAFGLWALPRLPDQVASHWGIGGQPDGWSAKATLVYLMPLVGLGLAALLAVVPRIDPRRANYELHGGTYWLLVNATLIFLAGLHAAMIGYNLGWPLPVDRVLGIGVGALFILIGNVMTRMRPNWFMGIRTPWTLSSDVVWRKTHRVGGYAFVATGVIVVLTGLLRPSWSFYAMVGAAGVSGIGLLLYSYLTWRKEQESGAGGEPAPR